MERLPNCPETCRLIRHLVIKLAPVILGEKPAGLLRLTNCRRLAGGKQFDLFCARQREILAALRLECRILRRNSRNLVVLFFRQEILAAHLARPETAEFLRERNYIPGAELTELACRCEDSTGEFPHEIQRASMENQIFLPEGLPVGLSSELLERRPDVRAAEQSLIAANAAVGVAYTNMFPKIALTGHFGLESNEFVNFIRSPYGYFLGNLITPLFEMGKNRAMWKAKKAAYEQSRHLYEKQVLVAFKETYDAIVDYNNSQEIYESRLKLEQSAYTTMNLASLQYINGYINYLDVLDAQRTYFDAQLSLNNAILGKQLALIKLYKALGGGW